MDESAALGTAIGQVSDTVETVKSPLVNNPIMKFAITVMASATVIFLTGYFFEKGSMYSHKS